MSVVKVAWINPDSERPYPHTLKVPWEDLCRVPALIDEIRRLFGEPTAFNR